MIKQVLLATVAISLVLSTTPANAGIYFPPTVTKPCGSGALAVGTICSDSGAPVNNCSVGALYIRTDGAADTSLYSCTATNTWTVVALANPAYTTATVGATYTPASGTNILAIGANTNAAGTLEFRNISNGASAAGVINLSDDGNLARLQFIMRSSGNSSAIFGLAGNTTAYILTTGSTPRNLAIGTSTANSLSLATGSVVRMTIASGGAITTTSTLVPGVSSACGNNGTPHVECGQVSATLGTCLVTTLCTVGTFTFATAYGIAPTCTATNATATAASAAALPDISAVSTTTATISAYAVAALTGDVITINVICTGA